MLGYKFTTEESAILARTQLAEYQGLPNPLGDTLYWADYNYNSTLNFWYIEYLQDMENVLGSPIEFDITIIE